MKCSLCKKCQRNYRMQKESYCPTCLVSLLKDKLSRRNALVVDLREQIKAKDKCPKAHSSGYWTKECSYCGHREVNLNNE